jgi:hypothetical protein
VERQTVKTSLIGSDKPLEDGAAVIRHSVTLLGLNLLDTCCITGSGCVNFPVKTRSTGCF